MPWVLFIFAKQIPIMNSSLASHDTRYDWHSVVIGHTIYFIGNHFFFQLKLRNTFNQLIRQNTCFDKYLLENNNNTIHMAKQTSHRFSEHNAHRLADWLFFSALIDYNCWQNVSVVHTGISISTRDVYLARQFIIVACVTRHTHATYTHTVMTCPVNLAATVRWLIHTRFRFVFICQLPLGVRYSTLSLLKIFHISLTEKIRWTHQNGLMEMNQLGSSHIGIWQIFHYGFWIFHFGRVNE